jgi:hypothetical protein
MLKFRDVLGGWRAVDDGGGGTAGDVGAQFRRDEEDRLAGLVDRRLGKPSPKRVPAAAELMPVATYWEAGELLRRRESLD